MKDKLVRQALLSQQDELLAVLDLARRQFHELLGRARGTVQQPVADVSSACRRELVAEVLEKRSSPAHGEEPGPLGGRKREEVQYVVVSRIVEVGDATNRMVIPV